MKILIYAIASISGQHGGESLRRALKDLGRKDLYLIEQQDISAVVSNFESKEKISIDHSDALDFAAVIDTLAQQFTLLPMRYASLKESAESITDMLETNYPEFRQSLDRVENKCEYGLKIFGDPENIKAELRKKLEIADKKQGEEKQYVATSVYRKYVNDHLMEHRMEESLLSFKGIITSRISESMNQLGAIIKYSKMTTLTNLIDVVFLLDKTKKSAVIEATRNLEKSFPLLNFVLTGPWPPYSFVDITLKKSV